MREPVRPVLDQEERVRIFYEGINDFPIILRLLKYALRYPVRVAPRRAFRAHVLLLAVQILFQNGARVDFEKTATINLHGVRYKRCTVWDLARFLVRDADVYNQNRVWVYQDIMSLVGQNLPSRVVHLQTLYQAWFPCWSRRS